MGVVELLAKALAEVGVDTEGVDLESAASRRIFRVGRFEDLHYVSFRRQFRGVPEGSAVVFAGGESRIVWGYPPIRRVLLPRVAIPKWFPGPSVVVEEKMNGYNVRVFEAGGKIYAVTRGGLICPYTTRRLRRLHGDGLASMLEDLGPDHYVAGEVVGLENPYTRYYYEESPRFGYFVFDIFRGRERLAPREKYRIAPEYGLRTVRMLGEIKAGEDGAERLKAIVEELEREGREGVVLKDPESRVEPLKYTTSHTNIGDLRLGMQFPFEEGRSFLFSRILREAFKEWEEGARRYYELGSAILEPAIESIDRVSRGAGVYEEFELELGGVEESEEVLTFFASLGVSLEVVRVERGRDGVRAVFRKPRKSGAEISWILRTGLSPLD